MGYFQDKANMIDVRQNLRVSEKSPKQIRLEYVLVALVLVSGLIAALSQVRGFISSAPIEVGYSQDDSKDLQALIERVR